MVLGSGQDGLTAKEGLLTVPPGGGVFISSCNSIGDWGLPDAPAPWLSLNAEQMPLVPCLTGPMSPRSLGWFGLSQTMWAYKNASSRVDFNLSLTFLTGGIGKSGI